MPTAKWTRSSGFVSAETLMDPAMDLGMDFEAEHQAVLEVKKG